MDRWESETERIKENSNIEKTEFSSFQAGKNVHSEWNEQDWELHIPFPSAATQQPLANPN